MDGKNVHLEMRNLKQTEVQRLEERKVEDKTRTYENRKPQETTPATLKRLKQGDDNGLERNLKLEKVVSSGWPWRQRKKEEQDWRMLRLPNCSVWPWRWTNKENQDWRRCSYRTAHISPD